MKPPFVTIILAAGQGKRMKSDLPKVLHEVAGEPMVSHVIRTARRVGSQRILLVVGHGRELVRERTADLGVEYVIQERQLGTGDAVAASRGSLEGYDGDILVLSGDVPLLTADSIGAALRLHRESGAAATVFTFIPPDPSGYGRIARGVDGELLAIVEEKDATLAQRSIGEVNGGVYFFRAGALFPMLDRLTNDNAAGEYYLTDVIRLLAAAGERLSAHLVDVPLELAGVNSREQLRELEAEYLRRMG